jgi:type I restriction enzyme R subunit
VSLYLCMLHIKTAYCTNGREIYQICMETGKEGLVDNYLSPEELWDKTFPIKKEISSLVKFTDVQFWKDKFDLILKGSKYEPRFYQELAINSALDAIAEGKKRLLLTLATGTGKTVIGFELAHKLFEARWNLKRDSKRKPRILFLADRNILANQAFNSFSGFPEDSLVRITTKDIRKKGRVPTNGNLFFTIFQTFMSGDKKEPFFGEYQKDFFDFIIIDECHRGGANDESSWRFILDHFSEAVQLGLTATPKRKNNADTYRYFGEPLYQYSLKEGIADGFLTPFRVRKIESDLDEYVNLGDDKIVEGEIEQGKVYKEADFNRIIEIKAREEFRVKQIMDEINQDEKTLVFCATQDHALAVRDLINQYKDSDNINYCHRVTANDGALGEQYLEQFQDNENSYPTILTTSYKLSTGVDCLNIRNIVLMRPIKSMIEFKQIIGRGTRLFDGKDYFTIYDFVKAYHNFADPEWDGDPIEPDDTPRNYEDEEPEKNDFVSDGDGVEYGSDFKKPKLKIQLAKGKELTIQVMKSTLYFDKEGKPISAEQFLKNLYGDLPNFFKNESELRKRWANPNTRKELLKRLSGEGYDYEKLKQLQKLVYGENSDLMDVLGQIAYNISPITREKRVANAQSEIFQFLNNEQKEFVEFVLMKYIESEVFEINEDKLTNLLKLKYHTIKDAKLKLGEIHVIRNTFVEFQKYLYSN